jgi:hypothetical protein
MPVVMIKSDRRAREKPCLRCGYSLRKIDSQHCPECGLSVWMSLNQNDGLEWSRPEWLRRMSLGLSVMAGSQALGLIPYALLALILFGVWSPARGRWVFTWASLVNVAMAAYLITYHVGLFILTTSEQRYPDRLRGWRIGSWVVGGIAGLLSLFMLSVALSPVAFGFLFFATNFVVLASAIVTLGYLRRLAKRIPNSTLARICAWLMFVPVIPFLKVVPFFGLYLILSLFPFLEFLPLIYLPVSAVLFVWFALAFRKAATSAEVSWASETSMTR